MGIVGSGSVELLGTNTLRHVAIVMDGNNRWARQRGLPGPAGHRAGVERVRDVLEACQQHGVEVLTVFAFSSENWRRPRPEVDALMSLFMTYLKKEARELARKGIRLRVIGNRERFSERLRKAIAQAEDIASEGTATLVIAADYGGRWDIAEAARAMALAVQKGELDPADINETSLANHTCLAEMPAPDLLIRTGGEQRISNFMLWKTAYTELYFTDKFWPDFGAEDLAVAVADFHQRQRRFGLSGEQIKPTASNGQGPTVLAKSSGEISG